MTPMVEIAKKILDFFLHIDKNLVAIVTQYGGWTYGILFLIIFLETGFVITPFLPGDSLIFAAGALAAGGNLSIVLLYFLLISAAILGDTVNYWIGHYIGPKAFEGEHKFLKKEYLYKAQKFYEKHGGHAIVLARFVPIVRTFAPFVAGVSKMSYKHFIIYNVLGGILWVSLFSLTGFFFGNLPFFKNNFEYVILVIVAISLVPIAYEFVEARKKKA